MAVRFTGIFSGMLFVASFAAADNWPQWMGPTRDGLWHETGTLDKFPEGGLTVKWRTPIHGGYAGPAVVGGKVFVTDYVLEDGEAKNDPGKKIELRGKERVLCLDAATGQELWKHEYNCPYKISYPCGPRTTPTVDDDRVYTLGAEGNLFCLKTGTGDVVWSKDLKAEYHTAAPHWGFSGHPLIDGEKLICLVGGKGSVVVAFDKQTGKELWKAISAEDAGYCPPSIIEAGGTRQLIEWTPDAIYSLDPETGKEFWHQPLKPNFNMSIMMPRKSGDFLFASGIGEAGALFKLDPNKPAATVAWRGTPKNAVYCANSTPIVDGGVMYGVDCKGGQLRAVDFETGNRLWESFAPTTGERRGGHGTAFLVKNGDQYFLFSETGDLVLAKLSPEKYDEISRFHVLEPTGECFGREVVWTHPAFAEKCCFARNDKEIVCVSLAK